MALFPLLAAVWLIMLCPYSARSMSERGCFPKDRGHRAFSFNPSANPTTLVPETCTVLCGVYQKPYAALYAGQFCFCGDTLPAGSAAGDANCSTPCAGNSSLACGGTDHVMLYDSPAIAPPTGLTLTSNASALPNSLIPPSVTGSPVTFDISVRTGSFLSYRMDYDDGAGMTVKNATDLTTRSFHLPGMYAVRVQADDFHGLTYKQAVTTVKVRMSVQWVSRVVCDELWTIGVPGQCVLTVYQGSMMGARTGTNGVTADRFPIADPELMLVGPAIQTKDPPLSMNIHGVVRAQAYTVQKTGHLIGWEMMVAATGVIKILVLTPKCTSGQYCFEQNACGVPCDNSASCPNTSALCLPRHDCVTCNSKQLNATRPQVGSYEVTKVVPISVNTTGFVYQDCSYFPDWLLQPGDIIGYDEQHSAGKLGWLHCPEWNAVSSSAAAAKEGDVYDSVPTHSGYCLALRAVLSGGTKVHLLYNVATQGTHVLQATLENLAEKRGPHTVTTSVLVWPVLPKPVISGPDYVGLGSEVMLTVLTPEGEVLPGGSPSNVTCDFDVGTCFWQQGTGDNAGWMVSLQPGPTADHSGSGSYIYLDANTLSEGNKALLESPVVDIVSSFGCLDFWYHMHGSGMGTLSLLAATPGDESNAKPIWSQSGHQGQDWKKASVTVNTTNPVKLLFSAERGLSWTGNMAIDDIVFTSGMCIGSRTLYTWDLGDGTIHENVTATSFNHTYTSRGTYTINVTAFNPVSSSSSATLLQVQEHVESLNLSAGPLAEKWKPFNFSISPQKGSHYSCLWDFGNGNTLESDDGSSYVLHNYTSVGNFSGSVNCSNKVSWDDEHFILEVQERITGLRLSPPHSSAVEPVIVTWELSSGSNVTWEVNFNDRPLEINQSASDVSGFKWKAVSQNLNASDYAIEIRAENKINNVTLYANYSVQTYVDVVSANASTTNTTTGSDVFFYVNAKRGSNILVTMQYMDGTNDSKQFYGEGLPTKNFSHVFTLGGDNSIVVNFSNGVSFESVTLHVNVVVGVKHLLVDALDFYYYPPAEGTYISAEVKFVPLVNGNASFPENAKVMLDLRDQMGEREHDLPKSNKFNIAFLNTGLYYITATLWNHVDSKNISHRLVIVEEMVEPRIELDEGTSKIALNQSSNIHFVMFAGPTGDNCNLTWDNGDGNFSTTNRTGKGMNGRDTRSEIYTSVGSYTFSVNATSYLESVLTSKVLEVIEPVGDHLNITASPPNAVFGSETTFTVTWTNTQYTPPEVRVHIDYGDGSVEDRAFPINTSATISLNHTYLEDALFNVTVKVYNPASYVEKTMEAGSFKRFMNVTATTCYRPDVPRDVLCKRGLKDHQGVYSIDKEVKFNVTTDNEARALWYEINATHEESGNANVTNATVNPFALRLTKPGSWNVTIRPFNPLFSGDVTVNLTLVETVVGFKIGHIKKETKPYRNKTFEIAFERQGSETCLTIDFGDNTTHLYADSEDYCRDASDSEWKGELRGRKKLQHMYVTEAHYVVVAEAKNDYSSVTQTLSFDISEVSCTMPEVAIENSTHTFFKPHYYRKGDIIKFRGMPLIECANFQNNKSWEVHEIDRNWGNVTGLVTLNDTRLDDAELRINRWTLDYKLYRVTFNMSMLNTGTNLRFLTSNYSYFMVVKSPLVGMMMEGGPSEVQVSADSKILTLTPLKYSYDPDVFNKDPSASNMSVKEWTCGYRNSSKETLGKSTTDDCPTSILANSSLGTSDHLTVRLEGMIDRTYEINVTMTKDDRNVTASLILDVVNRKLERVKIECAGGSTCHKVPDGYLVLKTSRLGLRATCQSCGPGRMYTYRWSLSIADFRWVNTGGWRPLREIDITVNNKVTGLYTPELAIAPELLSDYDSEYNTSRFKAECTLKDNGTAAGKAAVYLTLNTPPHGGNCSIEPKEMHATTEKLFAIECADWEDDTGIAKFEFFSTNGDGSDHQLTWVVSQKSRVSLKVSVPQGLKHLDYTSSVYVVVRDVMGAASPRLLVGTVRVTPAPAKDACSLIKKLPVDQNSTLAKKSAEGDLIHFTEFANSVTSIVNSDRLEGVCLSGSNATDAMRDEGLEETTSTTPQTTTETAYLEYRGELQRDNRAKLREKLLELMLNLPLNDVLSMDQIAAAMRDTLKFPDEVTNEAQNLVMEMMLRMSERLADDESVTREERMKNLKFMIGAQGSSLAAGGTSGFTATLTMLDRAKNTEYFDDYDEESDDCVDLHPKGIDEAVQAQKARANCILTRRNSTQMVQKATTVKERILTSFQNNSVHLETDEFTTEYQQTTLSKTNSTTIRGKRLKLQNSSASAEFSEDIADFLSDASIGDNDSLVLELTQNEDVPLRYSEGAKKLAKTSAIVTVGVLKTPADGSKSTYISMKPKARRSRVTRDASRSSITVTIPNKGNVRGRPKKVHYLVPPTAMFQIHRTEIETSGVSLHVKLCPEKTDVQFVVVFSQGYMPDHHVGHCDAAFLVPANLTDTERALCRTVMLGNTKIGTAFVGVRQLLPNETNMDVSDCKLPRYWTNSTEFLHSNVTEAGEVTSAHVTSAHVTSAAGLIFSKSTEAAGVTPAIDFSSVTVSPDPSVTSNYSINMFTTACYGRSEVDEDWNSEGLTVHPDTDDTATVCMSTRVGMFASGWSVAPNRIDWNYVFGNLDFDKNPTIYVTQIVIVLLYILAVVKARRKDKRDIELLGFAPLMDNDPNDKYFYEIEVVTGMRSNAGTKSKVYFVLSGEEEESEVREFADNKRPIFQRGSTNGFLMATPRPLGEIHYARIWHDNSGKGKFGGWYLSHVTVRDVQTGEKWMFIANKWFSVEEDDGKVDRILYSSSREQMTEFSHRFKQTSKRNMTDEHLWFSVLARPPQSRFTCVQRVSCCVCLLYLSMLASAMFYKGEDSSSAATAESLHYGPFVMSYEQLYKGVMCNLIVFPASFFIIALFRKARPRHKANVTPTGTFDNSQVSVRFDNAKMDRKSVNDVECGSGASSSMTSVPENSLATKKKKLSLPWWCRLVAWFLLIACTVVSAFFVTAYGIMFGDDKSRKWITSLLVSFVMSVFITQPVKVFLFAIIVSLFLKEPSDADDTEEKDDEDVTKSTMLGKDELPLHEMNTDKTAAAHRDKAQCKPPSKTELKKARRRRMQEVEMWAAVREVVIYAIYISLLLLISYRTCTANTFLYKDTMERVFIKSTDTAISFDQIRNVEDFWAWAKSGLVNGLRAGPYYNNFPPFMLRGFVNDKVSKIVGYATMRQLRTGQGQCVMDRRVMATIRECNAGYEIKKQEEGEFDIGWKPRTANSTVNDTAEWYRYSPADELNGYPHLGRLAVYSGGGYVVRLLGSRPDLADLMNRLEKEKWIDRYTRAVIVEFTTYNAQVNLFGIATIIAEFAPSGGVVQEYHFEPALLLPYVTTSFYVQVACEILYCLIIVFFIVRLLMVLVKEKAEFFYCFWNLVDLSIISLSISAIVIYFYRLYETKRLVQKFKDTQGVDYINFQYVRYWNELFGYMVGWTVFLATLKFLPLIRFNEKMSLLGATLKKSSRSLIQFSIIFWIVFLSFSWLFHLTFMSVDIKYSSFISSVVSGVLMMMGKFEIYKLVMAEPVLALIFFFLFVTCVTFIIVNMFVSILNDTFSAVRRDKALKNDLAIISFMFDRIKRMAGRGDNTSAATATVTPLDETPGEHVEDVQDPAVTAFPDRVDCLLRSLARYYGSRDDGDYQQQLAVLGRSAASRQGHSTPRL